MEVNMPVQVIDLFCGVGGLTKGLLNAGLDVRAGFDVDQTCQFAYSENNGVPFISQNIRDMTGEDVKQYYDDNAIRVLVGCAPCQPFSTMRFKMGEANYEDEKYNLLNEFGRIIESVKPVVISMENVPQIQKTQVFQEFVQLLERMNYYVEYEVVFCPDYGIPQRRRRFVLLASLLGEINLISPTHERNKVSVRQFIGELPKVNAGEINENDSLHIASGLSPLNIRRIQASVPGGTWRDWPENLRCECHKKKSGQTYSSVYGRMHWDQIGPTITTQFYSYGTGRYGHPEQDRALTLREGALLQTFPQHYNFIDPNKPFVFKDVARHIGNAVPVRLGEIIGISIRRHLEDLSVL